jgi:hypothetical protein
MPDPTGPIDAPAMNRVMLVVDLQHCIDDDFTGLIPSRIAALAGSGRIADGLRHPLRESLLRPLSPYPR